MSTRVQCQSVSTSVLCPVSTVLCPHVSCDHKCPVSHVHCPVSTSVHIANLLVSERLLQLYSLLLLDTRRTCSEMYWNSCQLQHSDCTDSIAVHWTVVITALLHHSTLQDTSLFCSLLTTTAKMAPLDLASAMAAPIPSLNQFMSPDLLLCNADI